jgi:hypothetical protein
MPWLSAGSHLPWAADTSRTWSLPIQIEELHDACATALQLSGRFSPGSHSLFNERAARGFAIIGNFFLTGQQRAGRRSGRGRSGRRTGSFRRRSGPGAGPSRRGVRTRSLRIAGRGLPGRRITGGHITGGCPEAGFSSRRGAPSGKSADGGAGCRSPRFVRTDPRSARPAVTAEADGSPAHAPSAHSR